MGRVEAGKVLLLWNSGTDEFLDRHAGHDPAAGRPGCVGTPARAVDQLQVQRAGGRPVGQRLGLSNTVSATTGASADTVAPTTPVLNSASDVTTGQCPDELWFDFSASTDDMSAVEHELRTNGVINEVIPEGGDTDTITYHEFRGPFTVTVVAVDLAGNASAPSNAITVSTQGGGCF